MRIVLIQPRGRWSFSICPEPPLGLAYLAACLLEYRTDLEIEIIDGFIMDYQDYVKKISHIKADIIGVTSTMSQLDEALRIPSMVGDKDAKFIIGGAGVSNLPSSRLYESGYSIICFGEGERTIVELIKAFENKLSLRDVKGISFLSNEIEIRTTSRELIENLDDIPLPARDLLNMEKYIGTWKEKMGIGFSQIVSSRGCPFSCRFCDHNRFGKKFRFMSTQRVIEEMRQLYYKYKAEMIFFEEDLFVLNKKRVLDLCDAITKEFSGKKWGANARVDTVDFEMLSRMKQAGCTDLNFGIESGSQRILDFLGKGITVSQIRKAFKMLHEVGINGGMFLLIGVPGETQKDIDMTKRLIAECEPYMINLWYLTPFPGTEIFEMTKDLIRKDVDFYNWNDSYETIYRKDIFEVQPKEEFHQIMKFFLDTFKGKVDPKLSIYDGTIAMDTGII
jgi:anaerobic magnesium-protoporphyrin IX monomethyl ester cyclase